MLIKSNINLIDFVPSGTFRVPCLLLLDPEALLPVSHGVSSWPAELVRMWSVSQTLLWHAYTSFNLALFPHSCLMTSRTPLTGHTLRNFPFFQSLSPMPVWSSLTTRHYSSPGASLQQQRPPQRLTSTKNHGMFLTVLHLCPPFRNTICKSSLK
jgi:hypothetical protein